MTREGPGGTGRAEWLRCRGREDDLGGVMAKTEGARVHDRPHRPKQTSNFVRLFPSFPVFLNLLNH